MLWLHEKERVYEKWRPIWFKMHPPDIAEYSWTYLFTGGKQIRPTLFCELWNYLEPGSQINYDLAFAIECIHCASLILDDSPWMDNATERRGRPTLHTVYSPKKALLITYNLIDLVQQIWRDNCPATQGAWTQLLKEKIRRLIIGQQYDLDKINTDLYTLASLKTGVLFELVTETVAVCIHLDPVFWRNWGNNLGVLFQWVDDWSDREEDIQQCNRNAFNEAQQITQSQYYSIWNTISQQIGPEWFRSDFGSWMTQYFTIIPQPQQITDITATYPHVNDTIHMPTNTTITGKHILSGIWYCMNKEYKRPDISRLWGTDEKLWDNIIFDKERI